MIKKTTSITQRTPDCVTQTRIGNTVLTVSGYFKQNATETAADKMVKVIQSEETRQSLNTEQAS